MKYLKIITVIITTFLFSSCQNSKEKNNILNQDSVDETQIQDVEEPEPQPKFIVYKETITTPYYPDFPQAGGVSNDFVLKLSLDFKKASLNGPMTRISETQSGIFIFIEGSLMGISFYPTDNYVKIYTESGSEFGTLYKTNFEY